MDIKKHRELGYSIVVMTDYLCQNKVPLDDSAWNSVKAVKEEWRQCVNNIVFNTEEVLNK